MKFRGHSLLWWAPRAIGVLFTLFIAMFSFDVFMEYSGWEAVVALFMHMIPAYILLALLVVAWKREKLGGALFLLLAGFYVVFARFDWIAIAIISGPLVLVGGLFILSAREK